MAWNEPGGDNDDKDPWSSGDDRKSGKNSPPDLDDAIQSLINKFGAILGSGGGSGGSPGKGFLIVGGIIALLWMASGTYIVNQGNRGVVTRFGAYTVTTEPGLNWHWPTPFEAVETVNVEEQRYIEVGYRSAAGQQAVGSVAREALMLTKDENIVDIRLAVQYQVKDAPNFLFNVLDPGATLKQVTESAQRGVIGSSTMDFVLTEGRTEVVARVKEAIQTIMDNYKAGILITSVNLQDAQPPEEVQGAFEDAIKAREDKQRLINEAQAYSNSVVPKARGEAARIIEESEGYRSSVVARAKGETSRFLKMLGEYRKAPEVIRTRMYLDTMESVFSQVEIVVVDTKNSNNLLYLPLDRMAGKSSAAAPQSGQTTTQPTVVNSAPKVQSNSHETSSRGRAARGRR